MSVLQQSRLLRVFRVSLLTERTGAASRGTRGLERRIAELDALAQRVGELDRLNQQLSASAQTFGDLADRLNERLRNLTPQMGSGPERAPGAGTHPSGGRPTDE
jgi:hypothetical protein